MYLKTVLCFPVGVNILYKYVVNVVIFLTAVLLQCCKPCEQGLASDG